MPVRFNPNGFLDIASDDSDLPSEIAGNVEVSGAMRRCTNLHVDQTGVAKTRYGSAALNGSAIDTAVHHVTVQGAYRYAFAGTEIYRNESSIGSWYTSALWSSIQYSAYNSAVEAVFALNGTDRKRIEGTTVSEWGIEAPSVAPTLAVGLTTGLTGNYYVKYTYCRKESTTVVCESNPSPASAVQALSNESLLCTFTKPTDTQVTHIRVYRTLAGGSIYYHDQDIDVTSALLLPFTEGGKNLTPPGVTYEIGVGDPLEGESSGATATVTAVTEVSGSWAASTMTGYATIEGQVGTFEDEYIQRTDISLRIGHVAADSYLSVDTDTADDALGSEVETDHDRPPLGTVVFGPSFDGYCFIVVGNLLYFCKPRQPEYWPSSYYVEVSPLQHPLKALTLYNGTLYALSDVEIYQVQGTGYRSFAVIPMKAWTGTRGQNAVEAIKGYGIMHLGPDGIYGMSDIDIKITQQRLDPLFHGTTVGSLPGIDQTMLANCILKHFNGRLYFAYPSSGETYPDNVLRIEMATGKAVHYEYPFSIRCLAIDDTNMRLVAGGTDGYVYAIEDGQYTDDDSVAISWQIESKAYGDQLRRYFPRYARYDVDLGASGTAIGYVLLDDASVQSHTISTSRNGKLRHVASSNGERVALRITGTGAVSIYSAEIE